MKIEIRDYPMEKGLCVVSNEKVTVSDVINVLKSHIEDLENSDIMEFCMPAFQTEWVRVAGCHE